MKEIKKNCPHCGKKINIGDYNLQWHKFGRQGKCPKCKKKVYLKTPARGLINDSNGVAHRRFSK